LAGAPARQRPIKLRQSSDTPHRFKQQTIIQGGANEIPTEWDRRQLYRNFKVAAHGIKENWGAGGPKRLWSRPLGEGHSAILAEQGRLYTMYSSGNREVIISLDAATGKTIWQFPYEANTRGLDLSAGKGPHSTPLIAGNLIYAVGVKGTMHALDKNNGRMVWKHDLWSELGGSFDVRGYSPSPVAYRNTVIVPVGGRSGQCLMAFDQRTGAVVWKNINFAPAQASPMIINVGGQDQIVHCGQNEIYGADATNGALLWSHSAKTDPAPLSSPRSTSRTERSRGGIAGSPAPALFTPTTNS